MNEWLNERWESYSTRKNIIGMKTGQSFRLRIVYRRNYLQTLKPYRRFLFNLDEFTRGDWLNDDRKFYPVFSLRYYNQKRKNKGWKMLSPIEWVTNF